MKKLLDLEKEARKAKTDPKPVISQGAPNLLTESRGSQKAIKTRQVMLNKHLVETITDVLLTEDVGDDIKAHGVRITFVSVRVRTALFNCLFASK